MAILCHVNSSTKTLETKYAPVTLDSFGSAWVSRRDLLSAGSAEVVLVAIRSGPGRNGGAEGGNERARGKGWAERSAEEGGGRSCRHGVELVLTCRIGID